MMAVQVPTAEGQALAAELGVPFFEASAKDGTGVKEAFTAILRATLHAHWPETATTAGAPRSAPPAAGAPASGGGCIVA